MRALFWALTVGAFLPAVAWSSGARAGEADRVVAVFDIETSGIKLDPAALDRLSIYLAGKVAGTGVYQVVPRDELKKQLQEDQAESYKACYDESCQIELGRELAAQKSLSTKILRLGDECLVSLTLYNLRTSASERAADATGACGVGALVRSIEKAVIELAAPLTAGRVAVAPVVRGVEDQSRCPGEGARREGDPPPKGLRFHCINAKGQLHGVMKAWHQSGALQSEMNYKAGKLHGPWVTRYPSGVVLQRGQYRAGLMSGAWQTFDLEGRTQEDGKYAKGKKTGVWSTYREGKKATAVPYKRGKRSGVFEAFDRDGFLTETGRYQNDLRVGTWELRRPSGSGSSGPYKRGKRNGVWVYVGDDGEKTAEHAYRDDKRHGPYTRFLGNGRRLVGTYKADREHGLRKSYDRDGKLESETMYRRGDEDGKHVAYHDNGKPSTVGENERGDKTGVWTSYDASGEKTQEVTWANDKRHGPITRYRAGKVYETGSHKKGDKHGAWLRFDAEGNKALLETFERRRRHGPFARWRKGVLSERGTYEGGRKVGEWASFGFGTDQPSKVQRYVAGKLHGDVVEYRADGSVKSSSRYEGGRRLKK